MLNPKEVSFKCYRPSPVPALSPLAKAVLRILADARGYLAHRGMSLGTIAVLVLPDIRKHPETWQSARGAVSEALGDLEGKGLAEERGGLWRKV